MDLVAPGLRLRRLRWRAGSTRELALRWRVAIARRVVHRRAGPAFVPHRWRLRGAAPPTERQAGDRVAVAPVAGGAPRHATAQRGQTALLGRVIRWPCADRAWPGRFHALRRAYETLWRRAAVYLGEERATRCRWPVSRLDDCPARGGKGLRRAMHVPAATATLSYGRAWSDPETCELGPSCPARVRSSPPR